MKLTQLEKMDVYASAVFLVKGRIADLSGRVPEAKTLRKIIIAATRELERKAK